MDTETCTKERQHEIEQYPGMYPCRGKYACTNMSILLQMYVYLQQNQQCPHVHALEKFL